MKALLVGNYPADEQHSLLGFRNGLFGELTRQGVEVRVICPEPRAINAHRLFPGSRKWLGYIDKLALFPRDLRRAMGWADIVHLCEHSSAIYTRYLQKTPHLVTCHDMMGIRAAKGEMPEWSVGRTGRMYQRKILEGLCRAGHIACISDTTRTELERISGLPASRLTTIYNGLFYPFRPMAEEESRARLQGLGMALETPFLLHVGHNAPTKNRMGLLKIYRALRQPPYSLPFPLVMAGQAFTEEMQRYVVENGLQDGVRALVGPDNEQIRALYSRAKALIFPSLYEGFGMPVIEAQACGCPVFTSNRAPLNEVGGDAAIYFDPTQTEVAARIIACSLESAGEMAAAGLENVKRFTTQRMAEGYLQTYQRILESPR